MGALSFGINPISGVSIPSPMMVGYAVVYTALALSLALRWFSARDI